MNEMWCSAAWRFTLEHYLKHLNFTTFPTVSNKQIPTFEEISEIPNIKPDAFLTQDGTSVIFEIEKSNKKTIWFDFIKILMFIGQKNTDFGIIIVPRNYAHKIGVWDLFKDARYYRSCLERFANVDTNLLSKIAIIGYTQEVYINENWVPLDSSIFSDIKKQANEHFSSSR